MATGFEKFSKKALTEDPIRIEGPTKTKEESEETRKAEPAKTMVKRRATLRTAPEEKRTRRREQKEGLETVTLRLSSDTKRKLDEMKFRSRRLLWELVDEAINDLYEKFN